jgi:hypothetical protein
MTAAPAPLICDDCEQQTDWQYAVQTDPWGRETGEVFCDNCAEKRYDNYMEYLMETT